MKFSRIIFLVAGLLGFATTEAHATNQSDILVGMQTLQLMPDRPTGNVVVAIVYDPTISRSRGDAEDIMDILNHGVDTLGFIKPVGLMVPVTELGKLSKARVAIIAEGTQAAMNQISIAATESHVLTMSTDIICVRTGKCVLGIVTERSVEIYYNKAAAEAAKISFSPAFVMLVKPV